MSVYLKDSSSREELTEEKSGPRVLVAEDQAIFRMTLSKQLPKAFQGSTISFVDCGDEATKALRGEEYIAVSPDGSANWIDKANRFDVAFLDHNMPVEFRGQNAEKTGVSVAVDIRRSQSDEGMKCMLVSHSSTEINESDREMRDLFDEVVVKPATPREYKAIAARLLERKMSLELLKKG